MRKSFATTLHEKMKTDDRIFLVVGDLGFGLFTEIRKDFPERFINCGAAEQAMVGIGVGLSLKGKVPFVYSITPFLLFRAAETIRNYVNEEQIKIILCGSGRDNDYHIDGFSHAANDTKPLLSIFKNIKQFWPEIADDIPEIIENMIKSNNPSFVSLKR